MDTAAEANLLKATRSGDPRAGAELLDLQRAWLAPFVSRHVRRREDAEDLVQDVLLRASSSLDRFRGDCPFSQWVLRIARHALVNYYQRDPYRRGRLVAMPESETDLPADLQRDKPEAGPSSVVESRVLAERMLAHMASVCSDDERRVICMVYQGDALEDAAEVLGKSASTVRSLYRRGRQKLLARLVTEDPDMLGGRGAVEAAWGRALQSSDAADRPTAAEEEAWRAPTGRLEAFRSACLKMARYLAVLLLVRFWE